MDRPELLSLLRAGHDEIVMLRRKVEELEPKARAYEHISTLLDMIPQRNSQGYTVDVAWRIKQAVEGIVAEREAERQSGEDASGVTGDRGTDASS